jgi:uncharacterized protein (TIGR03067 family)
MQIEANAGTHYVDFSPNKKQIVTGSELYDKENDASSTSVAVAYPLSGITEWMQTVPGWSKSAFTSDGKSVVILCGRESIRVVNAETGQLQHEIKAADSLPGGQWKDFAIEPQRGKLILAGVTAERRGIVEIREVDGQRDANAVDDTSAGDEVKVFQGEWTVVGLEGGGHKATEEELQTQKWSVEGNTITGFAHGSTGKMRFTLNSKKSPKEIDLTALDGNLKGTTRIGIYEFQNGRLRICSRGVTETDKDRPKDFTLSAGSGCGLITLERRPSQLRLAH